MLQEKKCTTLRDLLVWTDSQKKISATGVISSDIQNITLKNNYTIAFFAKFVQDDNRELM